MLGETALLFPVLCRAEGGSSGSSAIPARPRRLGSVSLSARLVSSQTDKGLVHASTQASGYSPTESPELVARPPAKPHQPSALFTLANASSISRSKHCAILAFRCPCPAAREPRCSLLTHVCHDYARPPASTLPRSAAHTPSPTARIMISDQQARGGHAERDRIERSDTRACACLRSLDTDRANGAGGLLCATAHDSFAPFPSSPRAPRPSAAVPHLACRCIYHHTAARLRPGAGAALSNKSAQGKPTTAAHGDKDRLAGGVPDHRSLKLGRSLGSPWSRCHVRLLQRQAFPPPTLRTNRTR